MVSPSNTEKPLLTSDKHQSSNINVRQETRAGRKSDTTEFLDKQINIKWKHILRLKENTRKISIKLLKDKEGNPFTGVL